MILWVTSPEFKIWVQGPVGRGAGALLLPDSGACGGGASSPRPLPGPSTLTRYPEGADIGPSLPERGGPGGPTSAGAPARRPAARREPGSRGQTRTDQRGPQSRARKARRGAATLRLCLPEPDELCARRPPRQARASAPCLSRRGCRGVGVIPDSPTAACFLPYPGLGEFAAETKVNNWARLRGGSGYHIQVRQGPASRPGWGFLIRRAGGGRGRRSPEV